MNSYQEPTVSVNTLELLKAFLQVPELSNVGSEQERTAFIALRLDGRTVRETAQAIGFSKSHVANLAELFQARLRKRIAQLRSKRVAVSAEFRTLYLGLYEEPWNLQDASGSIDDWYGGHKVGNYNTGSVSREDWAEVRGTSLRDLDE